MKRFREQPELTSDQNAVQNCYASGSDLQVVTKTISTVHVTANLDLTVNWDCVSHNGKPMAFHLPRRRCLRTNLRVSTSVHSINSHVCLHAARSSSCSTPSFSARSRSASTSKTSVFTFARKSLRCEMRWCHHPCVFMTSKSNSGIMGILLIRGVSDAKIVGRLIVPEVRMSTLAQRW